MFKQSILEIQTQSQGFYNITQDVADHLLSLGTKNGLLHLFLQHTSASLTITENYDPDVQLDLLQALEKIAPTSKHYHHSIEGPDDMPAHIKNVILGSQLSIPFAEQKLQLGRWQAIYLVEHKASPHTREIIISALG